MSAEVQHPEKPPSRTPRASARSKVRFGLFEADLGTGELRKSGIRIRIQAQPFRVLSFLLERPGEVVTREEVQQRLWGNDTIVDFDHSLGTAINKIREALGDSAENPRFIETLARRGYRFIAPVLVEDPAATEAVAAKASEEADSRAGEPTAKAKAGTRFTLAHTLTAAAAGTALLALAGVVGYRMGHAPVAPPRITQITFSGRVAPSDTLFESLAGTATDGARIYFAQIEDGRALLAQALIADGETSTLGVPAEIAAPSLGDISPDGSRLLLRNHLATGAEQALWVVSTIGGAARQIPGILAHDATWMPDGQRILYATGNDLYIARDNGSDSRKLASLPGRAFWLRWAPDGRRLRLTLLNSETHTTALWELSADGRNAHPLLSDWDSPPAECCGSWTADGKDYIFQSNQRGISNIWELPEEATWWGGRPAPIQITNGPLSYQAPITARSGNEIFFIGLNVRSELLRYDERQRIFEPYEGSLSTASRVEFSRDGAWVAWIKQDDGSLWRSRADGTQRVQLTARPLQVFLMHWAPDDKHLVLMGHEPGNEWRLYTVDAEGGRLQPVLNEARNEADPDWSPNGDRLVFGRLPQLMAEETKPKAISIVDLGTHQVTQLPGSDGLFSPRWSSDGRYIAALSIDQSRLMLYDTATGRWRMLAQESIADPVWSHDNQAIFFHDFAQDGQPIYRVNIASGKLDRVADLHDLRSADAVDYRFAGLAPGDVPLVSARMSTANIYSADLPQ